MMDDRAPLRESSNTRGEERKIIASLEINKERRNGYSER
jgi:hypothetical protein